MVIRISDCGVCRDVRVDISMTRNEAEILAADFNTMFGSGSMFTRLKSRLLRAVTPVEAKPKKSSAKS